MQRFTVILGLIFVAVLVGLVRIRHRSTPRAAHAECVEHPAGHQVEIRGVRQPRAPGASSPTSPAPMRRR